MDNNSPEKIDPNNSPQENFPSPVKPEIKPLYEKQGNNRPETIINSFLENVRPYTNGRDIRTDAFKSLPIEDVPPREGQTDLCIKINSVIGPFIYNINTPVLEWVGEHIYLVDKPGISYEDGRLNIGPGVDREQIQSFILEKFAEETKAAESTEPIPPIPPNLAEPVEETLGEQGEKDESEAELHKRLRQKDEQPRSKWAELSDLLSELDVEFEFNEEQVAKFDKANPEKSEEKYNEIKKAIEYCSSKNSLKEKFSTIRFGYPQIEQNLPPVSLEGGVLYVDLGVNGQELINFLNSLFIPTNGEIPETPEPMTKEKQTEIIAGIEIDTTLYDKNKSSEDYDVKSEIGKALLYLNDQEIELLKSKGFTFAIKDESVLFPTYYEDTKTLDVGFGSTKKDIILAIRTTVIPSMQPAPNPTQPEQIPASIPPLPEPISPPTHTLEPIPTPTTVTQEANVSNWRESEEWKNLEETRKSIAEAEARAQKETGRIFEPGEIAMSEYDKKKEAVAEKIKESIKAEMGTPLNADDPEYKDAFQKRLNDELFEFAKSENKAYKEIFNEGREKNWKDKAGEMAAAVLNSKFAKWYTGINKWVRLGATTVLFTVGGYALGTAAVGGTVLSSAWYAGGRGIRGAASILGGGAARAAAENRWSEKDIDNEVKEREYVIKNSSTSIVEKSKELEKLRAWEENEKKWAKIKKGIITVGVGAGAGILAGLTEGVASGKGLGTALESKGGKVASIQEHKLPPRQGYEPTPKPLPTETSRPEPEQFKVVAPKPEEVVEPKATLEKTPEPAAPKPAVEEADIESSLQKMFEHPDNLKHIKVEGKVDSFWDVIKKGLDENKQYRGEFTEAQKQNVVTFFTNKGISDPAKYNLIADPDFGVRVEPGKEVNLSKLFGNAEELQKVLNGAAKKTLEEQQEILDRSASINAYLHEHQGVKLTNDKVAEILNYKPKAEVLAGDIYGDEAGTTEIAPQDTYTEGAESGLSDQEVDKNFGTEIIPDEEPPKLAPTPPEELLKPKTAIQEQLENEIVEAKKRIGDLKENNVVENSVAENNVGGNRQGLRTMNEDVALAQEVDKIFKENVDEIYGKRKWLRKIDGINTEEWGFMKRLPANKVIEYFRDPENSDLPKSTEVW